jgi:hypothetical protein
MSKSYVSKQLRVFVEARPKGYCEYCLASSMFSPSNFEMEHTQPESKGGNTDTENLALACRRCNGLKFTKTQYKDEESKEIVDLYNPRKDNWHFHWNTDETMMKGKTAKGRVTINLLQVNRQSNINQREILRLVGLHPPTDYP